MRSLSTDAVNALAAGTAALATLVKFEFPGATITLNSSSWPLSWNGDVYQGAEGLGTIDAIDDRPGEMPGVKLQLLKVDSTYIALALDDSDQVQGAPLTISTAIIDADTGQIVSVETDWAGYCDTMSIGEDGEKAVITVTAESKAVDLLRGQTLTYTDADQRSLYPADSAFEYVVRQVDQPVIWPTREWFFK